MLLFIYGGFFLLMVLLYAIQFGGYAFRVSAPLKSNFKEASNPYMSVVIPFRNEAEHLSALLSAIDLQNYPSDRFEVLFVNDHSTDNCQKIIQEFNPSGFALQLLELPVGRFGKKEALDTGIQAAKGEIILQTDADCMLEQGWLMGHAKMHAIYPGALVSGAVTYPIGRRFWNAIEGLETLSLSGTGMASFLQGNPVICSGASLSYERSFYLQVRTKLLSIPSTSGDDMFLLAEAKRAGKTPLFLTLPSTMVLTEPAGTPARFLSQRIRWGSKARYYRDAKMMYLTGMIWLTNATFLSGLMLSIFVPGIFPILFVGFGIKFLIDSWFLGEVARKFQRLRWLNVYPLLSIIHPFYITFTGIAAMVSGYHWKERAN